MEEGAASCARHWGTEKGVQMGSTFVAMSLHGGEWESILHIPISFFLHCVFALPDREVSIA
jgi:hypothetical protein